MKITMSTNQTPSNLRFKLVTSVALTSVGLNFVLGLLHYFLKASVDAQVIHAPGQAQSLPPLNGLLLQVALNILPFVSIVTPLALPSGAIKLITNVLAVGLLVRILRTKTLTKSTAQGTIWLVLLTSVVNVLVIPAELYFYQSSTGMSSYGWLPWDMTNLWIYVNWSSFPVVVSIALAVLHQKNRIFALVRTGNK